MSQAVLRPDHRDRFAELIQKHADILESEAPELYGKCLKTASRTEKNEELSISPDTPENLDKVGSKIVNTTKPASKNPALGKETKKDLTSVKTLPQKSSSPGKPGLPPRSEPKPATKIKTSQSQTSRPRSTYLNKPQTSTKGSHGNQENKTRNKSTDGAGKSSEGGAETNEESNAISTLTSFEWPEWSDGRVLQSISGGGLMGGGLAKKFLESSEPEQSIEPSSSIRGQRSERLRKDHLKTTASQELRMEYEAFMASCVRESLSMSNFSSQVKQSTQREAPTQSKEDEEESDSSESDSAEEEEKETEQDSDQLQNAESYFRDLEARVHHTKELLDSPSPACFPLKSSAPPSREERDAVVTADFATKSNGPDSHPISPTDEDSPASDSEAKMKEIARIRSQYGPASSSAVLRSDDTSEAKSNVAESSETKSNGAKRPIQRSHFSGVASRPNTPRKGVGLAEKEKETESVTKPRSVSARPSLETSRPKTQTPSAESARAVASTSTSSATRTHPARQPGGAAIQRGATSARSSNRKTPPNNSESAASNRKTPPQQGRSSPQWLPGGRSTNKKGLGIEKKGEETEKVEKRPVSSTSARSRVAGPYTPGKAVKQLVLELGKEVEAAASGEIPQPLKAKMKELLKKCVASHVAAEGVGPGMWAMSDTRRRQMIITVSEVEPELAQYFLSQLRATKNVAEYKNWSKQIASTRSKYKSLMK